MVIMDKQEIYRKAQKKWGKQLQLVVAMEEMAELTKQISKEIRGSPNHKELASEIADVRIMLEQIEFLMGQESLVPFKEMVESEYVFKLKRLEGRLNDVTKGRT